MQESGNNAGLSYSGPSSASRVLVVDDEKLVRDLFSTALSAEFAMYGVDTAEEALPIIEHHPPDVILLDKNLPGMSGLDLLREVRKIQPGTEVILITGYFSLESAIEALRLGANDYLTKPCDLKVLLTHVRQASERKRARMKRENAFEALRSSEERLRMLFESAPDPYFLYDLKGNLLDGNLAAEKLMGYRREELVGKNLFDPEIVVPEQQPQAAAILDKNIRGESSGPAEITLVRKNGTHVQVEISTFPTPVQGRTVVLTIAREIGRRLEAESRIHEHQAQLEQIVKARARQLEQSDRLISIGELAAGVAHEINNPAAYVLTNLTVLRSELTRLENGVSAISKLVEENQTSELGQALKEIVSSHQMQTVLEDMKQMLGENLEGMDRIRSIVKDLGKFSHIEKTEVEPVDLNEIVRTAFPIVENELRHRAQVKWELSRIPPIHGHPGKLVQVVTNLLVNALHSIEEGAADRYQVRISTGQGEKGVWLSIEDNGCGIPEKDLTRIFDPFFTTKTIGQGTGLGLPISLDIVQKHRGDIRAESTVGEGSRFTIEIPLETGLHPNQKTRPDATPVPEGHRARVLVVDDEPHLLSSYQRILSGRHELVLAQGGEKALALLEKDSNFDVILCDLMMPVVDGPMIHVALSEKYPHLVDRVVFCTGGAFTQRSRDFLKSIKTPHVMKPLTREALLEIIYEVHNRTSPSDVP